MERRKINRIDEIWDGNNLLIKDFTNLDLENVDLSIIPMKEWEDCTFYNTNFKNTNIKFIPNKLKQTIDNNIKVIDISNCDFSDNDLSFLTRNDFCYKDRNYEIIHYGCNFRNTGINCLRELNNLILDESYKDFDYDFYGHSAYYKGNIYDIDIETIVKNPFLNISSSKLLMEIASFVFSTNGKNYYEIRENGFSNEYKTKVVKKCEEFLKLDKQGFAIKFYNLLNKDFTLEDRFNFFMLRCENTHLKDINMEGIPFEVFRLFSFFSCVLENVTINNSLSELVSVSDHAILDLDKKNEYRLLYLPKVKYDSWMEKEGSKKRISSSDITFFTKVYLELSRTCNANCKFCRNASFDKCAYDFDNIIKTLDDIKSYVNAVVIGGGEPTLRLNDVKLLKEYFNTSKIDWHMFTNGTNPSFIDDDYIMDNFKINLSRHAVNDLDNAKVFGINEKSIMTTKDIERLNLTNNEVTLNATCFNGGLDTYEKILEYIDYAKSIGCKKVLIQDLQKSISLGNNDIINNDLCIDDNIFSKVIEFLLANGFKAKYPIYATGGYVSHILTKDGFSISVQKYINEEELEQNWIKAVKRAFDLSIDPSGNLYNNWGQKSGIIKCIRK